MFDPQLPEHRAKYDHYLRLKRRALWIGLLAALAGVVAVIVVDRTLGLSSEHFDNLTAGVTIVVLVGIGAFMGYCELRRLLIFRADLRDQREHKA